MYLILAVDGEVSGNRDHGSGPGLNFAGIKSAGCGSLESAKTLLIIDVPSQNIYFFSLTPICLSTRKMLFP
jgi:hypothetical protein